MSFINEGDDEEVLEDLKRLIKPDDIEGLLATLQSCSGISFVERPELFNLGGNEKSTQDGKEEA